MTFIFAIVDALSELSKAFFFTAFGSLITILIFLLKYRANWRNIISQEFQCALYNDLQVKRHANQNTQRLLFRFVISSSIKSNFWLQAVCLEFNRNIEGNPPPNPMISEFMTPERGVYYLPLSGIQETSFLEYDFEAPVSLIQEINRLKPLKCRLVAITPEYGKTTSKWLTIK